MDKTQLESLMAAHPGMELIETHISYVLLGSGRVFKIKKPVKFSFLDYTTLAKRKKACLEEVRLNRRLAPDVYLGVVPVTEGKDGAASLDGRGKAIDFAVEMKRLPQESRMDALLSTGKVNGEHIRGIAAIVASFHKKIDVVRGRKYGSADVVKSQIGDLGNFRGAIQEACGMGEKVDFVLARSDGFIEKNRGAFAARRKGGMVKDCHGDLHSANIFIAGKDGGPGIVIFDCIEFNKDFRYIDTASEVAFMAMDLDAFGREEYSGMFVDAYVSAAKDGGLRGMLGLYKCYRANVRAKVAAIDWMQNKSAGAHERIRKYMLLAERYAKELAV